MHPASDDKSADTDKKESSDEATNDELKGHLVIYTSEPQDLVTEMLDDFVSKNPGVTYELYRSGTGDVKTKLSTELDAGWHRCQCSVVCRPGLYV